MENTAAGKRNVLLLVIVAAFGYFVDIYDLLIFSIIRIPSLTEIGVAPSRIQDKGFFIINVQMLGLVLGGVLWGIIGDKYGRVKALFGSILLYSVANIANGFVSSVNNYALIRFIAGIGLAGELGVGITLVTETMSKAKRGYGAMIVVGIGFLGAGAAAIIAQHFSWRISYFVGGGLGLLLLGMRMSIFESGLFKHILKNKVPRGNVLTIINNREHFVKYLNCILIGIPLWFVVGILVTFSPEFGKALGAVEPLDAGIGVMYTYFGITIGSIACCFLTQIMKSRKKVILIFHTISAISVAFYLTSFGLNNAKFIYLCLFMGFGAGYFANFITISAEQFGTNIRATVATTAPNFVRGSLIPITVIYQFFSKGYGVIVAAYIVMAILTVIAMMSTLLLNESFDKDLDYIEENDV